MISEKHKTVHVHIKKAGGTSVNALFSDSDHEGHHDILSFHKILGPRIKDFFVWSTIRNPWSRAVSLFHYELQHTQLMHTNDFKTFVMDMHQGIQDQSFNHFYDFSLQYEQFLDIHGRIALDYVAILANIKKHYNDIKKVCNLPVIEFPHLRKTDHDDYRKYYDHETIETIGKIAAKDIEVFGFVFEDNTVFKTPADVGGNWRDRLNCDFE